MIVMAVSAEIV